MGRVTQIWLQASLDPVNGNPFAIPANATNISIYVGGAGGGGRNKNSPPGAVGGGGGGGGAISYSHDVNGAGQTARVVVGIGGTSGDGEQSRVFLNTSGLTISAAGGKGGGNPTGGLGGASGDGFGDVKQSGDDGGAAT